MAPFFPSFAKLIMSGFPETLVIVTGGFRDRTSIEAALSGAWRDMVGMVGPAVVNPHLPGAVIFNPEVRLKNATLYSPRIEAPWFVRNVGVTALNVHMDNVGAPQQRNRR